MRQVLGGGIAHTKDAPMPRPRRHRWWSMGFQSAWPFAHPLVFEHFVEFSVTAVAPARRALQSSDNRELTCGPSAALANPTGRACRPCGRSRRKLELVEPYLIPLPISPTANPVGLLVGGSRLGMLPWPLQRPCPSACHPALPWLQLLL